MPRDAEVLLRAARDELYEARVLTTQLRNKTKVLAAAYADSERRISSLIDEIEEALADPHAQGGPGNGSDSQAHLEERLAAAL